MLAPRHRRRHIPLATGTAFAAKYQQKDYVTLCFFRRGAVNIGHSTNRLNMAALGSCRSSTSSRTTGSAWNAIERSVGIYDVASGVPYDMATSGRRHDVLAVRE